jgi:hypothetical protein
VERLRIELRGKRFDPILLYPILGGRESLPHLKILKI